MLTELEIERFRGIRSLALDRSSQVNLIVGRNDTSKTSFLEAIRVLMSGDPRHLPRPSRAPLGTVRIVPETAYKLAFWSGQLENKIRISGTIGELRLLATASINEMDGEQNVILEVGDADDGAPETLLEKGKEVKVQVLANGDAMATIVLPLNSSGAAKQPATTRRSFTKGPFPKVPPSIWLGTNRSESYTLARRYSDLYRANKSELLLSVLRLLEPRLLDLVVLSDRQESMRTPVQFPVLEARVSEHESFPLESMGDGFASVIAAVTTTAAAGGGLCLMDEVENGIHYSILPAFWDAIHQTAKAFGTQVWATTHSLDCVSAAYAAFEESPSNLTVHRFERKDGDEIKIHSFDHEMLGLALDRGLEVR